MVASRAPPSGWPVGHVETTCLVCRRAWLHSSRSSVWPNRPAAQTPPLAVRFDPVVCYRSPRGSWITLPVSAPDRAAHSWNGRGAGGKSRVNARLTEKSMTVADRPASAGTPALAVEGLRAGYRSIQALDDVSFALPRGSLAALIGPNGAGKSTLF